MNTPAKDNVDGIRRFLAQLPARPEAGQLLCEMVDAGLDRLSLPGSGQTLQRWRTLAAVAAYDLSLAKLYEAHADALAILAEAAADDIAPALSVWGVWCAEPPEARLDIRTASAEDPGRVVIDGVKAWCSGANALSHAIVSGWNADGHPCLAAVDLDQAGVTVSDEGWHAVGMAETTSVNVHFENARGIAVGGTNFYVDRPGFWQGGAGIAACWHGAAAQLASYLRHKLTGRDDPHALAHLGRADVALSASAAGLRAAAEAIDAEPTADSYRLAMRVRLATEQAAVEVMQAVGRALGAAPLCRDPWVARMMADLPVFLRQSHAERDLVALAQSTLQQAEDGEDGENYHAGEEEWRL
ncbi:hypothetical protein [Herbaspirillum lusitanum]|uniref:hypothetical protein n=1 Tax=Herbaspirillum lusitanum TaxID=213312 RepID=UPI0002F9C64B|nr:hypothetical protein [Herbaspirillum lusitanum]